MIQRMLHWRYPAPIPQSLSSPCLCRHPHFKPEQRKAKGYPVLHLGQRKIEQWLSCTLNACQGLEETADDSDSGSARGTPALQQRRQRRQKAVTEPANEGMRHPGHATGSRM